MAVSSRMEVSGAYNSSDGSVYAFVHRLSKPARRELVRLAVQASGGSAAVLAERVGVRRQSISKFLSGRAHPSDETMVKILSVIATSASGYVRREAARILREEMEAVVSGYAVALELLGPDSSESS
ncbi:MAG: helix-turn-helix domain-containing protein [Desulfurococcales archaeon]|nr:helix-turn-helix domain-containing protein [Desulfurococcales archaeon]